MSDRKTRQMVSKARAKNNSAIIVVLGCSVEGKKESLEDINADILIGNNEKLDMVEILNEYIKSGVKNNIKKTVLSDISKQKRYIDKGSLKEGQDVRETVKIEDGCNNFCSYCIIPYVRGRVRSRKKEEILNEIKNITSSNNVKEIIISGIEIASYGSDFNEPYDLIDLVDDISKIKSVVQIRLTSIEPRYLTEENIKRLSKVEKVCPHFHISMQSGCTETLKRMNRKYDVTHLIDVCNNLKKYYKSPYMAADVIVGFPKETKEEFEQTLETIKSMDLNELHVFKYSKRNYTAASKMDGQILGEIKNERSEILREYSDRVKEKFLIKKVGSCVKVLFESYKSGILTGLTKDYVKVKVKGDESFCGTIKEVDLISLEKETMIGRIKG